MVTDLLLHSDGWGFPLEASATEGFQSGQTIRVEERGTSRVGSHGGQTGPPLHRTAVLGSPQRRDAPWPATCLPHWGLKSLAGDSIYVHRPWGGMAGESAAF